MKKVKTQDNFSKIIKLLKQNKKILISNYSENKKIGEHIIFKERDFYEMLLTYEKNEITKFTMKTKVIL